jgi:ABC-type antimicrobial peptide transport system ATPase subunit
VSGRGPQQPLDAVNVAQLVAVSMRLAMEVSVLRDRLRTHEAILARQGLLSAEAVDQFQPAAEDQAQRVAAARELIEALARDIGPGD